MPYVVVMTLAVVLYKNLGVGNTEIALYTSWLYLPWVIKPLWSPLVDLLGRKRQWIVATQLLVGAALAAVALTLPAPRFLQLSLAVFWLMAFASATHDIAADGFYMLALSERRQAAFVGVRSLFYRLAMISGQGALVVLAGWLADWQGDVVLAWQQVLALLAGLMLAAGAWHAWALPRPAADQATRPPSAQAPGRGGAVQRADLTAGGLADLLADSLQVFAAFFRQPGIGRILAFLLLYRFAEAQLLKLVTPFMLDPQAAGGLGLKTQDVGLAYGTVGVAALTVGGLAGGWVIARVGLKRALWPLMACLHLPNLVYVALALAQPSSLAVVSAAIGLEQLGYGFGFTAYMVFMLMVADQAGPRAGNGPGDGDGNAPVNAPGTGAAIGPATGNPHKTAHYALCTGFMALGMMLPGMAAGWLQTQLGYTGFFIWVCVAALPSLAAAALVRIDPAFGRRDEVPGSSPPSADQR